METVLQVSMDKSIKDKVGDYNIGMTNNILTITFYIIWLVKI